MRICISLSLLPLQPAVSQLVCVLIREVSYNLLVRLNGCWLDKADLVSRNVSPSRHTRVLQRRNPPPASLFTKNGWIWIVLMAPNSRFACCRSEFMQFLKIAIRAEIDTFLGWLGHGDSSRLNGTAESSSSVLDSAVEFFYSLIFALTRI